MAPYSVGSIYPLKPKEKPKEVTGHPTQPHWHDMNRKQRRETIRKFQSEDLSLEIVHPDAGGIDIGNESHYVAVPAPRDSQKGRPFILRREIGNLKFKWVEPHYLPIPSGSPR
jgi:hypothetical protein